MLLSIGTPCGAEDSAAEFAKKLRRGTSLYPSWQIPDITHPVLGLHPKEKFDPNKVEKLDLKKLCHMRTQDVPLIVWEAAFFTSEQDATMALANGLKSKSKRQIEKMLGKTCFISSVPAFLNNTHDADQQWTYFVGGTKLPLVILFKQSVCIETQLPNDLEFSRNDSWGTSMISGDVGMTYAQIKRLNGLPDFEKYEPYDEAHKHCPIYVFYYFGNSHSVNFSFERGKCVERSTGVIFH